jgi:hypothetical protein
MLILLLTACLGSSQSKTYILWQNCINELYNVWYGDKIVGAQV